MGGKHKQAQRTKNNARPSSSGRSAELLRSTSAFVGFSSVKDGSSSILPGFSLATADETETSGNSEFKLVIKKMYKKDSTTKLKALQEFADLCKRSDVNDVKSALPQWPQIYNVLAVDTDHRVREASHLAQRQLALMAKKNLAPYLKILVGPWFTGQYDTYPPAATAAKLAFQDAFPPSKIVEAITFCQEEIFNYIYDNLINQTAGTLSNSKNTPTEEMEAKYHRVLISSLQGYAFYLQQLPVSVLKNSEEINKKLIGAGKFWKYARHSSPLVRSAWFSALIALCQKAPFLVEDQGYQVAHVVFGNLDEADPSTLSLVWEAALHALVTIKDCWSHVDPQKIVFPKLWRVLREGGQGNASTIFPNLLPFLSKIPCEVLNDKELFYNRFFENMRDGFKQTSVQLSQSESNAVSVTFIECLRYIIMINQDDLVFCKNLLINQLVPVLKTSFVDKKLSLCLKPLYSQVAALLYSWHKNVSESSCFEELVKIFWVETQTLICDQIHEIDDVMFMSKNHLTFIMVIKDPSKNQKRGNLKVRFLDPEENTDTTDSDSIEVINGDLQTESVRKELLQLVLMVCDEYCEEVNLKNSPLYVEALSDLILKFDSQDLLIQLAKNVEDDASDVFSFEKLLSWLQNSSMPTSKIVKVLFLLLGQLDTVTKEGILDSLYEIKNSGIMQWCIIVAITSHYNDCSVKKWLKSSQLSEILISIVKDISLNSFGTNGAEEDKNIKITWDVMKYCFSKTSDGDFPVSIETLISILRILATALSPTLSPNVTNLDPNSTVKFVGELTCALFTRESLPLVRMLLCNKEKSVSIPQAGGVLCDLALFMFTICCTGQHHASVLQVSTLALLSSAWQALVSSIAQALEVASTIKPFLGVTKRFANVIWASILPSSSVTSVEVAAAKAVTFIRAALNACPENDHEQRENILQSICEVLFECTSNSYGHNCNDKTIMRICLAAEMIRNSVCLKKEFTLREGDVEKVFVPISMSLFSMIVLSKIRQNFGYEGDEQVRDEDEGAVMTRPSQSDVKEQSEENEEESMDSKKGVLKPKKFSDFLIKFLSNIVEAIHVFTTCKLFLLHYKNDALSLRINSRCKLLKTNIKNVIGSMDEQTIEVLRNEIIYKMKDGDDGLELWTLKFLYSEILCIEEMLDVLRELRQNNSLQPNVDVQLIQVFSSNLDKDELEGLASEFSEKLLLKFTTEEEQKKLQDETWPYGCLSVITCALSHTDIDPHADENSLLGESIKIALEDIMLKRKSGTCKIFSGDMSLWNSMDINAALEVSDFLETCVRKWRNILAPHDWDLLLCSLVVWVQSVASNADKHFNQDDKNRIWWYAVDRAAITSSVFRLLATVVGTIEGNGSPEEELANSSPRLCVSEDLISEWRDVYAAEIYHPIIRIFSMMLGNKIDHGTVWNRVEMLLYEDVLKPIRVIPAGYVINCPFPCLKTYKGINKASYLASILCAHLRSSSVPLQTATYHLILKLVPNLVEEDMKILSAEGSDLEKLYEKLSCYQLKDHLSEAQSIVDTMLMDFRIGDSCTVQPFTDTYTYTIAYFLYWKIILEICRVTVSELRCHYAQWLRDSGCLNSLMQNLFRLLPEYILQDCSIKVNTTSSRKLSSLFESKLAAQSYHGSFTADNLEQLVCWVWGDTYRYLPALVRLWWNDLEPRYNALVERVTALYLSPLLCAEELRAVQAEEKTFSNMTVRVHQTAREVVAVYTVDDAEAELLIQLPNNHPLGLVKVDSGKNLFGTNQRQNWMRQITIFLNYQNGSIWDGLTLWKKNLDKRFEGVEECYICYSILHNSNYQIPKLSCQTCKKKFHSQCLYKWFSTSNNSTCPICRNLWKC